MKWYGHLKRHVTVLWSEKCTERLLPENVKGFIRICNFKQTE